MITGRLFSVDAAGRTADEMLQSIRSIGRHIGSGIFADAYYVASEDVVVRHAPAADAKLLWLAIMALSEANGYRRPFMPVIHDIMLTVDGGLCTIEELLDPLPKGGAYKSINYIRELTDLIPEAHDQIEQACGLIMNMLERYESGGMTIDDGVKNMMIRRRGERLHPALLTPGRSVPLESRAPQLKDDLVMTDPLSGWLEPDLDEALLRDAAPAMRMMWPGFAASEPYLRRAMTRTPDAVPAPVPAG